VAAGKNICGGVVAHKQKLQAAARRNRPLPFFQCFILFSLLSLSISFPLLYSLFCPVSFSLFLFFSIFFYFFLPWFSLFNSHYSPSFLSPIVPYFFSSQIPPCFKLPRLLSLLSLFHLFSSSFFNMKRRLFGQNALFYLNKNGTKTRQLSNQFSIHHLFI